MTNKDARTLADMKHWWESQSLTDCNDKGGHFNIRLYVRYLKAREQMINPLPTPLA